MTNNTWHEFLKRVGKQKSFLCICESNLGTRRRIVTQARGPSLVTQQLICQTWQKKIFNFIENSIFSYLYVCVRKIEKYMGGGGDNKSLIFTKFY